MNRMIKASCIFLIAAAYLTLNVNAAYSDAPGVRNPGKRVPAHTAKVTDIQKKVQPAKKTSKPRKMQPQRKTSVPKLVVAFNPLNEAVMYIKQERYRKALPYILCAADEQPGNPDVWYWFGVWSDKTGNFSNAQKHFTKALQIDPDYPALTRIVVYPHDPYGKNPLWDSIRPPSIEAIYSTRELNPAAYAPLESLQDLKPETPVYIPPAP